MEAGAVTQLGEGSAARQEKAWWRRVTQLDEGPAARQEKAWWRRVTQLDKGPAARQEKAWWRRARSHSWVRDLQPDRRGLGGGGRGLTAG